MGTPTRQHRPTTISFAMLSTLSLLSSSSRCLRCVTAVRSSSLMSGSVASSRRGHSRSTLPALFVGRTPASFDARKSRRRCSLRPSPASHIALFSSSSEDEFFSPSSPTFESAGIRSSILLSRLASMGLTRPSEVQASSYPALLAGNDIIIGAETGSGKTLGYLLPLLDQILSQRSASEGEEGYYDYCRAVILVPNKELANQVIRMATPLCSDEGTSEACVVWPPTHAEKEMDPADLGIVRIGLLPGGLSAPQDYKPFRDGPGSVDIVVTTPANLAPLALSPKNVNFFSSVPTLILDEADMLLDGGYIRLLDDCLMGFRRADKLYNRAAMDGNADFYGGERTQHVFVGATIPDSGLKSVDAFIMKRFPYSERVIMKGMHNSRHYGLGKNTEWIAMEDKGERLERVVKLLEDEGRGDKTMLFLNTVGDVDGATNGLRRAGINAIPYHAKIPLEERQKNLSTFRDYQPTPNNDNQTPPVLVCTDLASRGLDIPNVTLIIQLQFATNVVAHLHRMGRCGRAGKRDGRGVIFYSDEREGELVDVVRKAESVQEKMVLEGNVVEREEDEGKVKAAFSRRRGFTKKRKKIARELRENN